MHQMAQGQTVRLLLLVVHYWTVLTWSGLERASEAARLDAVLKDTEALQRRLTVGCCVLAMAGVGTLLRVRTMKIITKGVSNSSGSEFGG